MLPFSVPCFHPVKGWKAASGAFVLGARPNVVAPMTVPCGQCIGCRLERSRQWAVRMMHEASMHRDNCFITLTYSDENLPAYGSLVKSDFQKFMKRLRKEIAPETVRFFHAGEYGERLGRPHYHACLFGYAFPDKVEFTRRGEFPVYRSALLERLWPFGLSEVGSLTFESAAYVARYVTKKITGKAAEDHYAIADADTGEVVMLQPEYATMSRRPGIGARWLEAYSDEVYPADEVIMRGRSMKPPRAYDVRFKEVSPELFARVRRKRSDAKLEPGKRFFWNNTERRLLVREEVTASRTSIHSSRKMERDP